ncbi:hypothetical protein FTUN_9002 (plasmid) [Frigoriglobus tundricola]|uniref:Uncharacterized protein n=1 Tax=Frigoriglobus tundricola TaxID=2774151 RepID=A0A6M5Z4L4_9BACT|nr:hypothetical protein FTUN_9002 [Frigoriglobus tundricola]
MTSLSFTASLGSRFDPSRKVAGCGKRDECDVAQSLADVGADW